MRDYVANSNRKSGKEITFDDTGMESFEKMLNDLIKKANAENAVRAMAKGVLALIDDVRKLPKPRSEVKKSGYTHMLDSVSARNRKDGIEVGWEKHYGTFVERGTCKMTAQPHLIPQFVDNKEKYYKIMVDELNL